MQRTPLSKTECGIFVEQLAKKDTAYNLPFIVDLPESTDLDRLCAAVRSVVNAHPTLRTAFSLDETGQPYKYLRDCDVNIEILEAEGLDPCMLIRPFDLQKDILFRIWILKASQGDRLLFDIHHSIFDGTSMVLLLSQISRVYAGESIEPERFTAFDFAQEEADRLHSQAYETAKAYYRETFAGVDLDSSLYKDKNGRESLSKEIHYILTGVDADAVKAFALKNEIKQSSVFNGAFSYVLSRYTGSQQVIFATVHNGRDERLDNSTGMFVKTYPVYADLSDCDDTVSFLKQLDRHITLNRENDLYAYMDFCEDTRLNPSVTFAYHGSLYSFEFCGQRTEVEFLPTKDTRFDFELTVRKTEGHFTACAVYRQDQYDDAVIRGLLESFDKVLAEMLSRDNLCEIDMLTAAQRETLESFNRTARDYEITDVVTLFRRQAKTAPDNTALIYQDSRYTYREADGITEKIAAALRHRGVGRGDVVSVLIPRCEYMALASLGVLKSGAAYQPLDPGYPSERLEFMISDSGAKLLIADRTLMDRIPGYKGDALYLDEIPALPAAEAIPENPKPEDAFILLYTSGSTGTPKGVTLEHRNICNFCAWYRDYYALTLQSRVAAYASYGFDACMMDLYPALTTGAAVCIVPEEIRLDLPAIQRCFEENQITHSFMTTQVGRQFASFYSGNTLKHLSVGGETLAPLKPEGKRFALHNVYGPTECTIMITAFTVDRLYARVPIGRPLDNVRLYVVDENGKLLPPGAPGELWAAGRQVGRGYLNRPEKDAEVFIPNPFTQDVGYERVYRTGDVVRWTGDGNIDFIGRSDGQVKIRGFRIELAEVEAVIREFPGVTDATVQAFDAPSGGKFLAAYLVGEEKLDQDALRSFIAEKKPAYMVPEAIMQIDRIPLNQNQKVNRRALPAPERKARASEQEQAAAAPLNVLEKELKGIASEILGTDGFGVSDPFGELGLTSISSIRLASAIYQKYGVTLQVRELVSGGSLQSVENAILTALLHKPEEAPLTAAAEKEPARRARLSFAQQGVYTECQANPDSVQYNLPFALTMPMGLSAEQLEAAVRKFVDAHPYILCRFVPDDSGDIIQEPIPDFRLEIPVIDLEEAELEAHKQAFVRPFDLEKGPVVRFEIINADKLTLLADMHHLVSDGASMDLFFEELSRALDGGEIEKEQFSFYDFVAEERIAKEAEDFFAGQMASVGEATRLIPDVFDENLPHWEKTVTVPTDIAAVKRFALGKRVTPAAVYLAASLITFGRYVCEDNVAIATISNGRSNLKTGRTMGMFVNTLPIAASIDHNESAGDYLRRVAEVFSGTIAHEAYPFARIAAKYDFHPALSYAYQIGVLNEYRTKYGIIGQEALALDIAKLPAAIFIEGTEDAAQIRVDYDSALYSEDMMRGLAESIENAVCGLMNSDTLSQISLTGEKQWKVLDSYNKPWDLDYDKADTAVSVFRRSAKQQPDKTAVVYKDKSYTYRELDELTDRLAAKLYRRVSEVTGKTELGEGVISILIPRDENVFILPLAAVKAGLAYEPLDPGYPKERLNFMVKDAGACLLLAEENLRDLVDEYQGAVLTVRELYEMEDVPTLPAGPKPEDLFIMLYTSGSTGTPKGCQIEHRNVVSYAHGVRNDFYTRDDVIAAYASFGFDVNMSDVFCTLLNGGTVCLIPEDIRMNLDALAAYFDEAGVTALLLTTQVGLQFLQNYPQRKTLRMLVMGGEKLPAVDPSRLSYTIVNGYGPTENCCGVSLFPIRQWEPNIPIGKPMATIHGYVLDKTGHRLPAGAAGEYCLSGPQVSRGYLNRPDKTKEAYEPCPFDDFVMYHTGDIVRYRQNGDVEFVGRKDGQVKIRGFRIETKEVEAVIRGFAGIRDATVQAYDYEGGGKYLAAFIVGDAPVDIDALRTYIKERKPAYMVPAAIMQIDAIPLTVNQKVDKKALPKPTLQKAAYVAPESKAEEDFCAIFGTVLGVDKVSAEDDFFELGGSSILAMKVVVAAGKAGYSIVYNDVFSYTTPRSMARFLGGGSEDKPVETPAESAEICAALPEIGRDGYDYSEIHTLLAQNTLDAFRGGDRLQLNNVLLVGGTGFLGSHVLHALITEHDNRLFCFARPGKDASGEERLKETLRGYFGDDFAGAFGSRITVLEGDATDPEALAAFKAPSADMTVINCAAVVKHFAKGNEIERVNVDSVRNLIAWCGENRARLVHISTGSVAGNRIGNLPPAHFIFDEHRLYAGQEIDSNQYIHSKFMAERYIYEAMVKDGLRAKVMRMGNLAPRAADGEFQTNYKTNNYMNTFRAYQTLGVIPYDALDAIVEFSPIDVTARAVLALAETPEACVCFMPLNSHRPQMGDVVRVLDEMGYPICGAENEAFAQVLNEALADEAKNEAVGSLIAYQNSDKNIQAIGLESADNSLTTRILARLGFFWPETGSAYIRRFLDKLEQKGFFRG